MLHFNQLSAKDTLAQPVDFCDDAAPKQKEEEAIILKTSMCPPTPSAPSVTDSTGLH